MDRFVGTAAEMDDMVSSLRRLNPGDSPSSSCSTTGLLASQPMHPGSVHVPGTTRRVASHNNLPRPLASPRELQSHEFPAAWHPRDDAHVFDGDYDEEPSPTYPPTPSSRSFKTVRPPTGKSYDDSKPERRPSIATSVYSLYPPATNPPSKTLPPVPTLPSKTSRRVSSHRGSIDVHSEAASSTDASRYSQSSHRTSSADPRSSDTSPPCSAHPFQASPPIFESQKPAPLPMAHGASAVEVVAWKQLEPDDKYAKAAKDKNVYFFDVTTSSTTLASKHGNNIIRVWSVGGGLMLSAIKIKSLTQAQVRGRNYFVRSHAILSEPSGLIAIASGFGDSLELWDWVKNKKLQTLDKAERWAAVRSNVYESAFPPLVTYRGDRDTIDLWSTTPHSKKPFKLARTINLRNAGLPLIPKYPELAFSATGPILVAASGPRPPRPGHPPSENETLLVAWNVQNPDPESTEPPSDAPYQVVAPWQHPELNTALPCSLATYGSVAVSIWIPAGYRAVPVPVARGGQGYNLQPVEVPYRYVLVWDFSGATQTRTFRIPNAISCVSPDCRYVAYCDQAGTGIGARGNLVILDALSGKRLWCWPDPEAFDCGPKPGFEQLEALNKITEMSFSADGGFLFIGNAESEIGVFEVREIAANEMPGMGLRSLRHIDVGPIDLTRVNSHSSYRD